MNRRSFLRDLGGTAGVNSLLVVLSILTGLVAARLLGPEGRGELAAIQAWPMVLATLGILGMPDAVLYFASKRPRDLRVVLTSVAILAPLSVITLILGYLAMPRLMSSQSSETVHYARLYLLIIPAVVMSQTTQTVHRSWGNFPLWNLLRSIKPISYALIVGVAWILNLRAASTVAMVFLVSSFGISILIFITLRQYGSLTEVRPDKSLIRPMFTYGSQTALGSAPEMLNMRLDQLLMVGLLGPVHLGLYTVAVSWSMFLNPLVSSVTQVVFPYIAEPSQSSIQYNRFATAVRCGLWCSLAACLILVATAPLALPLMFGPDYVPALPSAVILTIAAAVWQFNSLLRTGLKALGYPIAGVWSEGTSVIITIALLSVLLTRYGILGAALASLAAYSFATVVLLQFVNRRMQISIRLLFIPQKSDVQLFFQILSRGRGKLRGKLSRFIQTIVV